MPTLILRLAALRVGAGGQKPGKDGRKYPEIQWMLICRVSDAHGENVKENQSFADELPSERVVHTPKGVLLCAGISKNRDYESPHAVTGGIKHTRPIGST